MKVYLLTTGSYSDYTVQGVFSTMEKAREAMKFFKEANDPGEYELDTVSESAPGLWPFTVTMSRNGCARVAKGHKGGIGRETKVASRNDNGGGEWDEDNDRVFTLWAKDENHAAKIANERRAILIAENHWGVRYEDTDEEGKEAP